MLNPQDIWHFEFLGNEVGEWIMGILTMLVTLTVLPIIRGFIAARRRRWTPQDRQHRLISIEFGTLLVARTSRLFVLAVALYLASRYLTFTPRLERLLTVTIVCLFWLQAGLWAMAAVRFGIDRRRLQSTGLDSVLTGSM